MSPPVVAQAKAALNKNLAVTQSKLAKRTVERDKALAQVQSAVDRAELAERSARDVTRERERVVKDRDALVKALELQMAAETAHLKCDECEGQEIPELCPKCFPLYDDARLARMKALSAVVGQALGHGERS